MYVANCGRLPDNWTVDNLLMKHTSRPYNPNIANVFYLAGFIESWGRGIEKICNACIEDDLPIPEFLVNPGDNMVKFTAPKERIVRGFGRVTEKENRVLELIQIDPGFTYGDLAKKLKLSRKTISARIRSLKKKESLNGLALIQKAIGNFENNLLITF